MKCTLAALIGSSLGKNSTAPKFTSITFIFNHGLLNLQKYGLSSPDAKKLFVEQYSVVQSMPIATDLRVLSGITNRSCLLVWSAYNNARNSATMDKFF